ncbi:MAG: hypothetical protein ACE15B_16800 [Bryobacteraceae bacterium]
MRRDLLIGLAALIGCYAQARIDPRLVGEWAGSVPGLPMKLVMQFEAGGACRVAGEQGTCQSAGDVLSLSLPGGGQSRYTYRIDAGRLTLSGGGFTAPVVLQRTGDAGPRPQAARPSAPVYQHPAGFSFSYPPGWQVQQQEQVTQLAPASPRMAGQAPAELYFVFGEDGGSEGITSPEDPRVVEYLEQQVMSVSRALRRVSGPTPVTLENGRAMAMDWEGTGQRGVVRARVLAVVLNGFGMALLAIGEKTAIEGREPDLRRIAGSFSRGGGRQMAAGPPQPAGGGSALDPRLVGVWLYEKNFWSGAYSSTNVKTAVFRPDGSFQMGGQFAAGMTHTDSLGDVTGRTSGNSNAPQSRGRWTASAGKLQIRFEDGSTEVFKYYIEDQSDGRVMLIQTAEGDKQLWTYKGR